MLELDEYQTIHTTCFRHAKEEGPLPFRLKDEKAPMYETKLNNRSIASIKAGSRRGRVDDILEYGIRLQTGLGITKDTSAARKVFLSVATGELGQYPQRKLAIAYSLATHSSKLELVSDDANERHLLAAGVYADKSAELGHFSYTCLHIANVYDGLGVRDKQPFQGLTALWREYDKYRLETGRQRPNARSCAKCDYYPPKRSFLKRCSGECIYKKKPVYCGRECQLADWPYHKQFCKLLTEEQLELEECRV